MIRYLFHVKQLNLTLIFKYNKLTTGLGILIGQKSRYTERKENLNEDRKAYYIFKNFHIIIFLFIKDKNKVVQNYFNSKQYSKNSHFGIFRAPVPYFHIKIDPFPHFSLFCK